MVGLRFAYSHNHVTHTNLRDWEINTIGPPGPISVMNKGVVYDLAGTSFTWNLSHRSSTAFISQRAPNGYITDPEGYRQLSIVLGLAIGEAIVATMGTGPLKTTYEFNISNNPNSANSDRHPPMVLDQHAIRHLPTL